MRKNFLVNRGGSGADNCVFCQIIQGERSADFVFQGDSVVAFKDTKPHAPVHILLVPKKHIRTLLDLKDAETEILEQIFMVAKTIAANKHIDHRGFRIVLNCNPEGGQTVYHLHAHVLGGRKMNWPPG